MTKLWKKKGTASNPAVTDYIISKDLAADAELLPYDARASMAHAMMLQKVGLLKPKEAHALVRALKKVEALSLRGEFPLHRDDEDCHTAIENYLVKKLGNVGKKIHTGRSRNDQVLVALRLFSKEKLREVQRAVLALAENILKFARKYEFIPMPGYTHTQQAMPSSVGQWAGSFVESLLDDYRVIEAAHLLNDQNPLGSAAGFGTGLSLDREYTTKLLGFARPQINALYCQNSRGKTESFIVSALTQVMMTLGKIANDLVWFTSQEFNFFIVDSSLTTGSSIMPQKRNLDIMEVVRANVSTIFGYQLQIQSAGHNLLSGYNKDLKITKEPLMDSFFLCLSSISITKLLFAHLVPNEKQLTASLHPEIFATDEVNMLVKKGLPFRDAYRTVGESLGALKKQNAEKNIRSKKHLGATGNLGLARYAGMLRKLKSAY